MKGCVFSPPSLCPVPSRGRKARKRNLSIASLPTPLVSNLDMKSKSHLPFSNHFLGHSCHHHNCVCANLCQPVHGSGRPARTVLRRLQLRLQLLPDAAQHCRPECGILCTGAWSTARTILHSRGVTIPLHTGDKSGVQFFSDTFIKKNSHF